MNCHDLIRDHSRDRVMKAIISNGPITKSDLIAMLHISRPTVIAAIKQLCRKGLVTSTVGTASRGRLPQFYSFNPLVNLVAGIDLGGTKVRVALAGLDGTIIIELEEPTEGTSSKLLIRQIGKIVRKLCTAVGRDVGQLACVAIGSPGVMRSDGTLRLADNISGLHDCKLGTQVGEHLGTSVVVQNDVNLAAYGEHKFGVAQQCRNFVLLSIGTGIGLGMYIDGRLISGATGAAGEVAYLPIGIDPQLDESQSRGSFEVAASGSGVQMILGEVLSESRECPTELLSTSSVEQIFAAATNGDPLANEVVKRHVRIVAEGVLSIAALLDPEIVVMSGGIGASEVILEPLRIALKEIAPFTIHVVSGTLGARAGIVGAAQFACDTVHSDLFSLLRNSVASTKIPTRVGRKSEGKNR